MPQTLKEYINYFDPLQQFDNSVLYIITCAYDLLISIFKTPMVFVLILIVFFTFFIISVEYFLGNLIKFADNKLHWQLEYKYLYIGIESYLVNTLTKVNSAYYYVFIFIGSIFFIYNNVGLLPYLPTLTSQLIFVFAFAFVFIAVLWLNLIEKKKLYILSHFLPPNLPLVITPFLVLIELISALSRIFSLAIRLFSNITAGHALSKILASFFILLLKTISFIAVFFSLLLFLALTAISILEILIASLQVYVFLSLLLIYINEEQ
jgi:F-type H+-transporting ATPase subunit a